MMDMNKTTQKVREAMQQAQEKALRYGHQEIDAEHLLFAVLLQERFSTARRSRFR